jgi:predicted small lipoprotein YifL
LYSGVAREPEQLAKFAADVLRALLMLAAVTALAGCGTAGPRSLRYGRGTYNAAIQQTNSEQLLLNLVRLRYRDAPLFLEVTSISSSLSVELGASVAGSVTPGSGGSVAPGSSVTYIERPTITYAPLQGTRFGTQFLSPIELSDLLLLYHSGWAIDRIFKVFVQRLGSLQNAPRASGPTPGEAPIYEGFFEATGILRSLWSEGLVDLSFVSSVSGSALMLQVESTGATTQRLERLAQLLGLPGPTARIYFSATPGPDDRHTVMVVPRSLLGGMYYVSHGVEVPDEDYKVGRVPTTRSADRSTFDWTRVTGSLMRIRWSRREPSGAYVSVHYRGLWFYIADNDLDSKSTFSFLAQVLELQSGEIKSPVPILTLPVAGD